MNTAVSYPASPLPNEGTGRTLRARGLAANLAALGGAALAVYLLALKVWQLPCPAGSNCSAVISSTYGSILGIPVSAFGLAGWFGLAFGGRRVESIARLALLLGTLWFLGVQALILHKFCVLCLAHAGAVLLAAISWARPRRGATLLGFAVGLGAVLVNYERPPAPPPSITPKPTAIPLPKELSARISVANLTVTQTTPPPAPAVPPLARFSGKAWFGPITPDSPLVVVSFTCGHCVDSLAQLLASFAHQAPAKGARVMFITGPGNEEIHRHILAALLHLEARLGEQAGFAALFRLLTPHRDPLLTGNVPVISAILRNALPQYQAKLGEAADLLARFNRELQVINLRGTPYVLTPEGRSSYDLHPRLFSP